MASNIASYSISSLWNGWTTTANVISINKKARTATVCIIINGADATSDIAQKFDLSNLDTCIANKGLPLPIGSIKFPIFCRTDNTYIQLPVYFDGANYYLSLTTGKTYEIVGSYITENK